MLLHSVAHGYGHLQHYVAQGFYACATFRSMDSDWTKWRRRIKDIKTDAKLKDADIAAGIEQLRSDGKPVARATVNSWLNKREPNLKDFFDMCVAMGADPGHVLFEQPIVRHLVPEKSLARKIAASSPSAEPGHRAFQNTLHKEAQENKRRQEFKRKRARLRGRVTVKL